jgi:hypothetical protein
MAALTKYLLILSKSLAPRPTGSITETSITETMKPKEEDEGLGRTREGNLEQPPDAAFKRLHILHIVHDVLAFVTVKLKDSRHNHRIRCDDAAWESLKTHAGFLAQLAACSETKNRPGRATLESVRRILQVWQRLNLFDATTCSSITSKCEEAGTLSWKDLQQKFEADEAKVLLDEQRRREEAAKWVLPVQHHLPHDPATLWHDLPATNALVQKRTQGYPLQAYSLPRGGYRLKNGGQQADEALKSDVAELHKEALRCFDKYTNADEVRDIDALGNIIWKDRPTRNFWGFEVKS